MSVTAAWHPALSKSANMGCRRDQALPTPTAVMACEQGREHLPCRACFPLLTHKPSRVFQLHHCHPSICESSIWGWFSRQHRMAAAGMLQVGAMDWGIQHCWWHREHSDPGTLPRIHTHAMPGPGTDQGRSGLQCPGAGPQR